MFNILKKELKDSFRDRRTLLLTVLLPLILMSALVFFYESMLSTNEEDVYEVAVKDEQMDFIQKMLATQENLKVNAVEDVEKALEAGEAVAGIHLPIDFEEQIKQGNIPLVQIYSDLYSENSVVATSAIQASFAQYSQQIVADRLAQSDVDVSVLSPFLIEQVQIVEGDNGVMMLSFLIPLMLAVAVGIGISPAATDLIAGEKERRTMEALLMTPVNRSALLLAKWLTMVMIATVTGIVTLGIVFIEIEFFTEVLKAGLSFGDQWLWIIVISIGIVVSYAALMASALMLASIFAKTIKEAQSYSTPITMISILPAILMVSVGLNELSTIHFLVPVMNVFTIFKELFFGIINVEHILITMAMNGLAGIFLFLIARVMFMKDKWVLAE